MHNGKYQLHLPPTNYQLLAAQQLRAIQKGFNS